MSPEERKEIDGIKQEIALFQLNQLRRNEELQENIDAKSYIGAINLLETRIKILEEAHQRQVELNEKVDIRLDNLVKISIRASERASEKPKWKWW